MQPRVSQDRVAGMGRSRNKLPAEETIGPVFFTQGGCIHVLHFCIVCLGREAAAPAHARFWQLPSGTCCTSQDNLAPLPGTPAGCEHRGRAHPWAAQTPNTYRAWGHHLARPLTQQVMSNSSNSNSNSNSNVSLPNAIIIPMLYL